MFLVARTYAAYMHILLFDVFFFFSTEMWTGLHHEAVLKPGRDEERDGTLFSSSENEQDEKLTRKQPRRHAGQPHKFGDGEVNSKPKQKSNALKRRGELRDSDYDIGEVDVVKKSAPAVRQGTQLSFVVSYIFAFQRSVMTIYKTKQTYWLFIRRKCHICRNKR